MQSGTKCWQAARQAKQSGAILSWPKVWWRLGLSGTEKKAVGFESVWVTRDNAEVDMGSEARAEV